MTDNNGNGNGGKSLVRISAFGLNLETTGALIVLVIMMGLGLTGFAWIQEKQMLRVEKALTGTQDIFKESKDLMKWMIESHIGLQVKAIDIQQVMANEMRLTREAQQETTRVIRSSARSEAEAVKELETLKKLMSIGNPQKEQVVIEEKYKQESIP